MQCCMFCKQQEADHHKPESGFTLLEILMVIVILSVTSMMVVPSFFSSSTSLQDEAHRLVQTFRLAQDEAILSGQLLRVALRSRSYTFQSIDADNQWVAFNISPYQQYTFHPGTRIEQINPQPALSEKTNIDDDDPILAHLLFPPEGVNHIADITLRQASDDTILRIQFRPGPGGIRLDTTPE